MNSRDHAELLHAVTATLSVTLLRIKWPEINSLGMRNHCNQVTMAKVAV
jgi:hypothetical protein